MPALSMAARSAVVTMFLCCGYAMAEQTRLTSLGSLLADWRRDYREVQVLYRQMVGKEECFVVRTVPQLAPPSTKYVSVEIRIECGRY